MNYYLEKISKTQQQLDIAKVGFTQVTRDIIAKTDDTVVNYECAKEIAEKLNTGLDLIRELESQISFLRGKLREENAKEKRNVSKD